jgi:hypothetical protein
MGRSVETLRNWVRRIATQLLGQAQRAVLSRAVTGQVFKVWGRRIRRGATSQRRHDDRWECCEALSLRPRPLPPWCQPRPKPAGMSHPLSRCLRTEWC